MPPVFTVDTHLFRELGDLLVGRDSTALFELIKNAYDADSTVVTVIGISLSDPDEGQIVILDNGCGMDAQTFTKGFLRIASRMKEGGERRSAKFHRRFTGAKGIGRLSAHKLARFLQVRSLYGDPGDKSQEGIDASIDWDAIERLETLDQIESGNQVVVQEKRFKNELAIGTRITLSRLRRAWSLKEREQFVAECQSFRPPKEITDPLVSRRLTKQEILFDEPKTREKHELDTGFELNLEGDFLGGESLWPTIIASSQWVIEIEAKQEDDDSKASIEYGISPTTHATRENSGWRGRRFTINHPRPEEGPFYQARIFVHLDPKASPSERSRIRVQSGVRVYVEGFRILPYGEPGNDWLSLDADYARRSNLDFQEIVDEIFKPTDADDHWASLTLPNRSYFGGVFLTQEGATALRPLINREGFLPDESFQMLRDTVRQGIDLCTRVRAAATFVERERARQERLANRQKTASATASTDNQLKDTRRPEPLQTVAARATELLQEARDALAGAKIKGVEDLLAQVPDAIEALTDSAERLADEGPMLRVLASIGTQMAAFVHEIRSVLGTAQVVEQAFTRVLTVTKLSDDARRQLSKIQSSVGEMRQYLERQAAYLLDIVTPDATRRRSRQKLSERFEAGARLHRSLAEQRGIEILNEIPAGLKTPPMYPAEIATVFSNLLSNAVKAIDREGTIKATGERRESKVVVRVQNTGDAVNLNEAERWFRPFESSRTDVDEALGQGFGLGLTITRNMLDPYGATIHFVQPDDEFRTAVEIIFPE